MAGLLQSDQCSDIGAPTKPTPARTLINEGGCPYVISGDGASLPVIGPHKEPDKPRSLPKHVRGFFMRQPKPTPGTPDP